MVFKVAPPGQGEKYDEPASEKNIITCEPRNAFAHLHSSLLGNSTFLPVISGKIPLGLCQNIILVALDGQRRKNIIVTLRRN